MAVVGERLEQPEAGFTRLYTSDSLRDANHLGIGYSFYDTTKISKMQLHSWTVKNTEKIYINGFFSLNGKGGLRFIDPISGEIYSTWYYPGDDQSEFGKYFVQVMYIFDIPDEMRGNPLTIEIIEEDVGSGYPEPLIFVESIDVFFSPVMASLPSGTYAVPKTIELSCKNAGEIRYVIYNKEEAPVLEDVDLSVIYNLYSEQFEVTDNWDVVIYAQAWEDGAAVSAVESFEYNMKKETGGITMSNIKGKGIILGECEITFKGQKIGLTEDGASLTIELKKKAYTVDKFKEAPIARTKGVPTGKVKVKFVEIDKEKLTILSDEFLAADADGVVEISTKKAGEEEIGGELIVHPIVYGASTAYDIVFHYAFVDITAQGDFKDGGKTTVECEFTAGVDLTTEKQISIGRKATT